jgi:hypothetical protein
MSHVHLATITQLICPFTSAPHRTLRFLAAGVYDAVALKNGIGTASFPRGDCSNAELRYWQGQKLRRNMLDREMRLGSLPKALAVLSATNS